MILKMILLIVKHKGSYIEINLRQAGKGSKYYRKKDLGTQVARIKQSIKKVLDEDNFFVEIIPASFHEQGITGY